jgi:hypothetical protein
LKTKAQITEQLKKHLKQANQGLSAQRANTAKCRAFDAGDYESYQDKIQFRDVNGQKKRATVQFNQLATYTNAVVGFLAQNRRKPIYVARVQELQPQQFYSKYCNVLSDHCRERMNAPQVETQQDGDLITCGLGVTETDLSYGEGYASTSANGEVLMAQVDLDTYSYDPAARQTNLRDRRWDNIRKEYDLTEALELFSDSTEEDFQSETDKGGTDYQASDNLGGSYDRIKYEWCSKAENTVYVDFYQWYDIEPFYRADNPLYTLTSPDSQMGAQMALEAIANEADDEDFDPRADILAFSEKTKTKLVEIFGDFIKPEQFRRKVFYTAVCSGDKCFKAFKSIHQGFTRKVKTGKYDAKNKIWTGLVNPMMEPQKYYNKFLTELIFVIAVNSKGGVILESDAVEDIEEFEEQYARTDSVCVVRDGAVSGNKIMPKRLAFQPTGYEQLIQLAGSAISEVAGIDKSFLGSSENKLDTAMLQRQRIRQVVSSLACYVDSISLCQKEHAEMMLDLMRVYAQNNEGEMFRLTGDDSEQMHMAIQARHLEPSFDVSIEEAPETPEERAEMAAVFTQMGDKYLMAQQMAKADACYAMAAKHMNMNQEDRQKFIASITGEAQVDPAYVKQLEAQVQELTNGMTAAQVQLLVKQAEKLSKEAVKAEAETALTQAKIPTERATVQQKNADATLKLEQAQAKDTETQFAKANPKEAFGKPEPKAAPTPNS